MGRFGGGKAGSRVGGKVAVGLFRPALRFFLKKTARTAPKQAGKITSKSASKTAARKTAKRAGRRRCKSDPVDVASGEMILTQTDAEFAALLPLVLSRTHVSSFRDGRSFGPSWASTLDQRLEADAGNVRFIGDDGLILHYPPPLPSGAGAGVLPAEGPRWQLARSGNGYTITTDDPGPSRRVLHFASTANGAPSADEPVTYPLSTITHDGTQRIEFVREAGQLTEVRHSGGYRIAVDRSPAGLVTALRVPELDLVLMRYAYEANRLVEVINSSGKALRFDYDGAGRIIGWRDRNGCWYRYDYDASGRVIRTRGSGGFMSGSFAYGEGQTAYTDSLGGETAFTLNSLDQVVAETDPLGNTTRSEWDQYDRLLSRTDPLGRTTRYDYDPAGLLVELTAPDGARRRVEYDPAGRPLTVAEADGALRRYAYDARGNLVAETDPTGAQTLLRYDQRGHLNAVTDPLGRTTSFRCDAAGLVAEITDPSGAVTRYTRDRRGRLTLVTDPVGGVSRLGWTPEGYLAWRENSDGDVERWSYDGEGNVIAHTDPAGQTTRYEYTHFDLVAADTGPDGARLEFSYDTELRLTEVKNPQGHAWRYAYDPAGNLTKETDFNGRTVAYRHDAAGQLVERTDADGITIAYARDAAGNISAKRSGDDLTSYAYDAAGRLVQARNSAAELRVAYDPAGRILAETCNDRTVVSEYDAAGKRVSRRTPSGMRSLWSYDAADRPSVVRMGDRQITFSHDAAGREIERRINRSDAAAGAILTQQWDQAGRLTEQSLWGAPETAPPGGEPRLLQHRSYSYRPDGYVTAISDQHEGRRTYALDATGRVTAVRAKGWEERYAYDTAGNVTSASGPDHGASAGAREYDGTVIRRAGNVRYEHDARGRVVLRQVKTPSRKPQTWRYAWDADDRLTGLVTPDGQRWRYLYDPIGRRIAKQRLAPDGESVIEQTDFAWDRTRLVEQTAGSSDMSRVTTWEYEDDAYRPLAQTEHSSLRDSPQDWIDEQFHAIVADLTGAPVEMVDAHGKLTRYSSSSLWGTTRVHQTSIADCPLRFPGQYLDAESGLHYNLHRYYDPETARYASPDPLGIAPQPNPHAYVHNPQTWTDPLGLKAEECIDPDKRLYRFGKDPETPEKLTDDATRAVANDFPHGISTMAKLPPRFAKSGEYRSALVRELQDAGFVVQKTGNNPYHYTVHLPKPVTPEIAAKLNAIFKAPPT